MFSPYDPNFDTSLHREQDIAQAKSLLKKAGQENLHGQLITSPVATGTVAMATVLAAAGQGGRGHDQAQERSTRPRSSARTTCSGRSRRTSTTTRRTWRRWRSRCCRRPRSTRRTGSLPQYINLYKQANATRERGTRKQIEHEMQQFDFNQGGYIIPAFIDALDAYSTKITGYSAGPGRPAAVRLRLRALLVRPDRERTSIGMQSTPARVRPRLPRGPGDHGRRPDRALRRQHRRAAGLRTAARCRSFASTGGSPWGTVLGTDGAIYVTQGGNVPGSGDTSAVSGIQRVSPTGRWSCCSPRWPATSCTARTTWRSGRTAGCTSPSPGSEQDFRFDVRSPGRLFAVGPDGTGEMLLELPDVYPNGIAFDAQQRLYWTESVAHRICRLDDRGEPVTFCQLSDSHVPDGMAFAADGRLFVGTTISGGVTVISPDGEVLDEIHLGEHATNCIFDGSALYVTATQVPDIEASQRTGSLLAGADRRDRAGSDPRAAVELLLQPEGPAGRAWSGRLNALPDAHAARAQARGVSQRAGRCPSLRAGQAGGEELGQLSGRPGGDPVRERERRPLASASGSPARSPTSTKS